MYKSPSHLSQESRATICAALNAILADGLDLHSQIKVAHWNIRGPQFSSLHPLFETFAVGLAEHNDTFAERVVTLGGRAYGTVRHSAKNSRIEEYAQETSRDLEHVKLLVERFDTYLSGLRVARQAVDAEGDPDDSDLLTQVITEFEKHSWFLRASLDT